MTDNEQALRKILDQYDSGVKGSSKAQSIAKKVGDGSATYAEAYDAAREHGRILSQAYHDQLPELLTDGRLPLETAEAVVKPSMVRGTKEIGKVARGIQEYLNADAGIGIGFIEPDPNMDQIEGIIRGLCDSESYAAGETLFRTRVENCLEGYVDDCVHDNAKFQYDAGLSPKIERRAVANCCKWCSALAGVYEYERVSDTGNDVFRRHRNCHCQVLYSPDGSKKRQNVHSKRWTEEGKADRIAFAKRGANNGRFNTRADPMVEAFGPGEVSHPNEIAAYRREAAAAGVQIVERDYESLGYSPGLFAGMPGTLYISKGASYAAWTHEMQHMRDDMNAGWSGYRILADPDERYRREKRAYDLEIGLAKKAGRQDMVERLENNLEEERRDIYGIN